MISVVILTLDEEVNIGHCIDSLPLQWRADVHIVDSSSEDSTVKIAESYSANIHYRVFDNYAQQRNYALSLSFQNEWILMIDADERITDELSYEVSSVLQKNDDSIEMMLVRRKDFLEGKWLKRSSGYPTWFPRFFRKGKAIVSREINEHYDVKGGSILLEKHLLHYPFNKGIDWWVEKHNRYSSMEAATLSNERQQAPASIYRALLSADPVEKRSHAKRIVYKWPMRPFLIFIYLYFLRLGFLDGKSGYKFAQLRLIYELMIDVKTIKNRS